jgi:hypothetical protein
VLSFHAFGKAMGFGFGLFNQSVPIAARTAQWDHLIRRTISYFTYL